MDRPTCKPRHDAPRLGDLEIAVLDVLWDGGHSDAKAMHRALASRAITLSTVQSTLERLLRKRLVDRRKDGRAYVYRARVSRSDLIGRLIREVADTLSAGGLEPILSGFVDLVDDEDPGMLDRLAALVTRRRRRQRDG